MANQPKKYKKFVATAATATLVASAIVPVASAASFSDVPENSEFAPFIDALTEAGIINGYPSTNTFKPGAALTRGQVVKMLGRWVESNGVEIPSDWNTKARFTDVPVNAKDQELVKYAALVADQGVFGGAAGKLMAGNNITRQQMAKVLNGAYAAVNGESLIEIAEGVDNVRIPDLSSARAEFEDAIQALMDLEISSTSSGNFRPLENVTRAQFSKFLYNTINFEASDVAPFEIKAINNTTVEVIFQEDIESIDNVKFEIDGLKVTNAVVKQTSKRTAVLTTESQKGGTEYTVKVDGEKAGTFVGIAAVVPSKVELVSSSVQGKLGQEVKVQAKVTVAEGQAKAGIPVTFSIPGNANDAVYPTVTGEAYTDENGVATYTYTRYGAGKDTVTAYATGDRSKFAVGYVFWGVEQILSVQEVTEGSTINNGANKTYKVTFKDASTGKVQANKTLNVSVLENIDVTADKLQNVTINGEKVAQYSNNSVTPVAAQITTDSKGEATFTVSGVNAEVTPVVFEANNTTTAKDFKYEASDLQVTASKVKFAAVQADYTIELTRDGKEVAATGEGNGREYKILVKDKSGNIAKNETVNVAFNEDLDRVISTVTKAGFVNPDTDKYYPTSGTGNKKSQISVKTNDKGEATFVIASDLVNDYATPIAWIDINSADAKQGSLDEGEPKAVAAISHFQAPYLDGAEIKAYKTSGGKAVTKFDGNETAEFKAELVNQSGKVFTGGYNLSKVTYTVFNTGAEDVKVGNTVISPNRSETFTTNGASLSVTSAEGKTTSVRVVATGTAYKDGKDFAFTAKEATATFTATDEVPNSYTGVAAQYNPADSGTNTNSIWFAGKKPVKYAGVSGKTFKYFGANGNEVFGEAAWEELLAQYVNDAKKVTVSYNVDGDTITFKVINVVDPAVGEKAIEKYTPAAANNAPTAKVVADQTVAQNGTALTFTTAQLAEDVDTGDVLTILSAYTDNATIATTNVATGGATFTLTPGKVGTTTVTAIVADSKGATATTTFKVNVTAPSYLSVLNSGAPTVDYSAGTATAPKSVITVGTDVVTTTGKLTITADKTIDVTLAADADKDAILAAINTELKSVASEVVASLDASNNIVLTRPTTGTTSVLNVVADATLEIGDAAPTITSTAGSNGTATAAKYSFEVKNAIAAGSKLTVEVKIGKETVTLVEGTDFNGASTPAATATAIANALDTKLNGTTTTYTVAANGSVVVLTQDVPAPTTGVTLTVSTK